MTRKSLSHYIGVAWSPRSSKWVATIRVHGSVRFLGYYDYPIDAAQAYDQAALYYYGPTARTNASRDLKREQKRDTNTP